VSGRIATFLPQAVLLRLLAVLAIVLAPHLPRLLPWEAPAVLALILWRLLATLRHWRPLPVWLKVTLTIAAFLGVYAQYGNFTGQHAGVALLAVMAALKLTELNARRDVMVMVLLLYFILVTHFLFSQEIWTAVYLLVCAALITGLLIEANHPETALPLRVPLRLGGRMVLHALPLMVVLFLLFPRIPGPLWGLPNDSGAARTGLSDDMEPDEIQNLAQSNEVAFRVRFLGQVPPEEQMYWRGPVLAAFDGRRWSAGRSEAVPPPVQFSGPAYNYEMILEPQRRRWLLALDLPLRQGLPGDASLTGDYQLVASADVRERRLYTLTSQARYLLQETLPPAQRDYDLMLPRGRNPQTLEQARQWREQGLDDEQVVAAALTMFHGKEFYYTLHPLKFEGRDEIDEFLFHSRRGFCEHYASSFTVLMRAAGIPARVVTGYQGGHRNEIGDYFVVRQSEAHAWSEVWLPGRGWVRVDPTAAVAPQRIERGLGEALAGTDELPAYLDPSRSGYRLRYLLEARWDWANEKWNRFVLGYGSDLQSELLSHFGLVDWSDMILALTGAIALILGILGGLLMRQFTPRRQPDPVLALWLKAQRRLARAGLRQRDGEGPQDFASRVAGARPELATAMQRICALYLRQRYLQEPDATAQRELGQAVAALRP
jgi:protein-glutamine gamma-glutamyltransferase